MTPPSDGGPAVVRRFVVHGTVQGVGFRAFVWRNAAALGLSGWVRNRRDGTVEVLAAGDAAALDRLAGLLAEGPRWSRVTRVEAEDVPEASGFPHGFSVEPTV